MRQANRSCRHSARRPAPPASTVASITEVASSPATLIVRTRVAPRPASADVDAACSICPIAKPRPAANGRRYSTSAEPRCSSPFAPAQTRPIMAPTARGTGRRSATEPDWAGFRQLRVVELVAETSSGSSVYLALRRRPAAKTRHRPAGQYLTVRVAGSPGDPAPVRLKKTYSLPPTRALTPTGSTVTLEPHCIVSGYLHGHLTKGTVSRLRPPRRIRPSRRRRTDSAYLRRHRRYPVMAILHQLAPEHSIETSGGSGQSHRRGTAVRREKRAGLLQSLAPPMSTSAHRWADSSIHFNHPRRLTPSAANLGCRWTRVRTLRARRVHYVT